jgi:hypothetical protein
VKQSGSFCKVCFTGSAFTLDWIRSLKLKALCIREDLQTNGYGNALLRPTLPLWNLQNMESCHSPKVFPGSSSQSSRFHYFCYQRRGVQLRRLFRE